MRRYNVIYADPPWTFATRSAKGKGRSAEQHYGCMDLAGIRDLPVPDLAADDCALFMWITDPLLDQAFALFKHWGFRFVTPAFYWVKLNRDGSPFTGMGYWTRANPEQCLLATRGRPKRVARNVPKVILAPRREHSRKPDEVADRIVSLMGDVPRLEMFARTRRPGWDAYGNQVDKFPTAA